MSQFKKVKPRRDMDETYELNAPNSIDSALVSRLRPYHESPPPESDSSCLDAFSDNTTYQTTQNLLSEEFKDAKALIQEEDVDKQLIEVFLRFQPYALLLETVFVPFMENFEPAIGELDPFVKPPRPDGRQERLGLEYVDEPAFNQSNPTTLLGKLEAFGTTVLKPHDFYAQICVSRDYLVAFLYECEQNQASRNSNVYYSIPTPGDIILELWPAEMYRVLESIYLPLPTINLSLEQYVKLCCLLLDIPIADNLIESLHMLFTNYADILTLTRYDVWR